MYRAPSTNWELHEGPIPHPLFAFTSLSRFNSTPLPLPYTRGAIQLRSSCHQHHSFSNCAPSLLAFSLCAPSQAATDFFAPPAEALTAAAAAPPATAEGSTRTGEFFSLGGTTTTKSSTQAGQLASSLEAFTLPLSRACVSSKDLSKVKPAGVMEAASAVPTSLLTCSFWEGSWKKLSPPVMPAPTLRPTGPSITTTPLVMYSQQWSPAPSHTALAPEFRTAKRSPARPLASSSPPVAPYRHVFPRITLSSLCHATPSLPSPSVSTVGGLSKIFPPAIPLPT
mmetsp:Transcript_54383/g.93701  ORF Transcript_54383/g.93701 Transcript_54383/m.93701 type:complete len:282 (-) Transcript_54383:978-1823(-)